MVAPNFGSGGARPARIGDVKAAFLVESLTGNTWQAAEKVANLLAQERWTITGLSKVKQPDYASIQEADLILVGTWVHGAFVFGQAPWAGSNIANLPTMRGKRAAGFLTFALDPGKALDKLDRALGDTGAYVIGGLALNRGKLDEHSEIFAERLVDAVAVG
jgi:flavodoxin